MKTEPKLQIQTKLNTAYKRALPTIILTAALAAGFCATSHAASYTFRKVAALGEAAPGGNQYFFDFERGQMNDRGSMIYTADLSADGVNDIGEGVFIWTPAQSQTIALVLPGDAMPGGFTALGYTYGTSTLNNGGDAAFIEGLNGPPAISPLPAAFGIYRYSAAKNTLSPLLVPTVTLVPVTGGGVFLGANQRVNMNNRGTTVFTGIYNSDKGLGGGYGVGIFQASAAGVLSKVMAPGDTAPGGDTFDFGQNPWINDGGDIAFGGHVTTDEDLNVGGGFVGIGETGVYFRHAASGTLIRLAHAGDAAPGGGTFRATWGPILNNGGQVLFVGDLTPAPAAAFQTQAIFLYEKGSVTPVVRPGTPMPGGGNLSTVGGYIMSHDLNNNGQASFAGILDTGDEGIYVSSGGSIELVAKTGMTLPGIGTIANFDSFGAGSGSGNSAINDRGQVLLFVNLVGGGGALLVATPE